MKDMSQSDYELFISAMRNYEKGEFILSLNKIEYLCVKYEHETPTSSIVNLFFCMQTASKTLNKPNKFEYKLQELIPLIEYCSDQQLSNHIKQQYALYLLDTKKYTLPEIKYYAKYINPLVATGSHLNIHYDDIGYFKKHDENKTLLIYVSGGVGDKIMYCRFIRKVCETNRRNHVIFIVDDCLCWIYRFIYSDLTNIKVMKHSERYDLPPFDYHINITMLMYYLEITCETLYADYYLTNLPESSICMDNIIDPSKPNIIINWHGNYENSLEKSNRGMELNHMIPLLEKSNINWISVQKEVNEEEKEILRKYHVKNLQDIVDIDGDSFKDTLTILKQADLVISTDTSLAHIAATANVECWILLVIGCEWRWKWTNKEGINMWYPNMKMISQPSIGRWDCVIENVLRALEKRVS